MAIGGLGGAFYSTPVKSQGKLSLKRVESGFEVTSGDRVTWSIQASNESSTGAAIYRAHEPVLEGKQHVAEIRGNEVKYYTIHGGFAQHKGEETTLPVDTTARSQEEIGLSVLGAMVGLPLNLLAS